MGHLQDVDSVGRLWRRLLAVAAASVAVLGAGAAAADGPPSPATLIEFAGVARSFDVAGGRVAWIDSAWVLHVRALRSGAETTIRYTNPYQEVPSLTKGRSLVLGPSRVLWHGTRTVGGFEDADHVYVAAVGATRARPVAKTLHGDGGSGDGGAGAYLAGIAGTSTGFAYGLVKVGETQDQSHFQVDGGGVLVLTGTTPRLLPGAPPAIVLAENAGRVAIAPVDMGQHESGTPLAAGAVEIRNATTGALVSSVTPTGNLRAAALTPTMLVVLTAGQIVRYDAASGRLLGSTSVAADTAADLDASGTRVAFRRTRSVGVLDAATGRISKVVATPGRPTSVALDGSTLAWTEQRRTAPGKVSKKTFVTRIETIALASSHG